MERLGSAWNFLCKTMIFRLVILRSDFLWAFLVVVQKLSSDIAGGDVVILMTALMKTCFASKLHEFWRFSKHTDPVDQSLKLSTTGAFSGVSWVGHGWLVNRWLNTRRCHMHTLLSSGSNWADHDSRGVFVRILCCFCWTDLIWFSFWTCFTLVKEIPRFFDYQQCLYL